MCGDFPGQSHVGASNSASRLSGVFLTALCEILSAETIAITEAMKVAKRASEAA